MNLARVHELPVMFSRSECEAMMGLPVVQTHHDDDGHGHGGGHHHHRKQLDLYETAQTIRNHLGSIDLPGHVMSRVDEKMKLYRLKEGAGEVGRHRDDDYDRPDIPGRALWSILIYPNSDFTGGETVFYDEQGAEHRAPPHVAGSGLLFRHDLEHAGLRVLTGTKYVLKTDLFVTPR